MPIGWVQGPDGMLRWIPPTGAPALDSNGFPLSNAQSGQPQYITPWGVYSSSFGNTNTTASATPSATPSGVLPVDQTGGFGDGGSGISVEPTPIPNMGGITATGPPNMFSGPMDFTEMSAGPIQPNAINTSFQMPNAMPWESSWSGPISVPDAGPTNASMPFADLSSAVPQGSIPEFSPPTFSQDTGGGGFFSQFTGLPQQDFQMAFGDPTWTGTAVAPWAEPSPIPFTDTGPSITATGPPNMFGDTSGSMNTGGGDIANFGSDTSFGAAPFDPTQTPSITVMGDSPNVAMQPTSDPSGAGLVDQAPTSIVDQTPTAPNTGTTPTINAGPQSSISFGPTSLPTAIPYGPFSGGNLGPQFSGGAPQMTFSGSSGLVNDALSMMVSGGGGVGLRGAAVAEQTAQDAAPIWWFMHGGTQDSWDAMISASPVKQPNSYRTNVSAASAQNAANAWSSGGFSQKAGTSGTTTIG